MYANTAKIKVQIAPIEIFIRLSSPKVESVDVLIQAIKTKLKEWKIVSSFNHPINLTVIPMNWKIEIGI